MSGPLKNRRIRESGLNLNTIAEQLGSGSKGRGRHSPLFRFLYDNADAFRRLLADKEPSWKAVTDRLTAAEVLNGKGEPLTPRRVQRTWHAVEQAKGWKSTRQETATSPASATAASPLVRAMETRKPAQEPHASSPAADDDARARIARLKREMDIGSGRSV